MSNVKRQMAKDKLLNLFGALDFDFQIAKNAGEANVFATGTDSQS